jgi:hypothetical protein
MRSCELYRKIEGWASAVTAGAEAPGCSGTIAWLLPKKLLPGKDLNLH